MAYDMTFFLPILFGIGYWAIGYLETVIGKTGEPFDLQKTIRTLAAGVAVGVLQGIAGVAIDPAAITTWAGFDALLVIGLNKILNAYSNPPMTPPAVSTPAVPAVVKAAEVTPAPVSAPKTIGNDPTPGADIVTNPALLENVSVVQIGSTTYHPVFLMSSETRRAVEGQLSAADLASVDQQITNAELQRGGRGIPHYIITYSKGYYEINYGVVNSGSDTYFASTIISSSHDQTYDPAAAAAARAAAYQAAADRAAAAAAAAQQAAVDAAHAAYDAAHAGCVAHPPGTTN
jgi:hypothetical protein